MANNEAMTQEAQPTKQELNFRQQEQIFQRKLEEQRLQFEREKQELLSKAQLNRTQHEEEYDDEPYVDNRKLEKKLASFERTIEEKIEKKAEEKARRLLEEEKRQSWVRQNSDFNHVMSPENIQKFADRHPDLAEDILAMPEGFERQKLVYRNIKTLGLDKPDAKQPTIQEKIDQNRRSPYYQPSGVGSAPYAAMGDFSNQGQANAYQKMQELKNRLRMG